MKWCRFFPNTNIFPNIDLMGKKITLR